MNLFSSSSRTKKDPPLSSFLFVVVRLIGTEDILLAVYALTSSSLIPDSYARFG